jgi:ABC-type amino acid transport substrate-binding protein
LQSGEVDVLIRNATWTISRDTSLGLNFTGVNYYDGQGFMIRKSLNLGSRLDHIQKATRVARATAERKLAASLS